MIAMVLVAMLLAVLVWLLWAQLVPAMQSSLSQLTQLDRMWEALGEQTLAARATAPGQVKVGLATRVGQRVSKELTKRGIAYTSLRQDLALSGRSYEAVLGLKVLMAVGGFIGGLALLVLVQTVLGFGLPFGSPIIIAASIALGLFVLPDVQIREQAKRRRADFEHALSAYLGWVAMEMAGSAAPTEALPTAAKVGVGWPLELIKATLFQAKMSGQSQWDALAQLGSRVGVKELQDLGQLIALVSHDGAQVRSTLTARAATMQRNQLAAQSGDAESRDRSMRMSQIVIALGFIVFIGYPAVIAVLAI